MRVSDGQGGECSGHVVIQVWRMKTRVMGGGMSGRR